MGDSQSKAQKPGENQGNGRFRLWMKAQRSHQRTARGPRGNTGNSSDRGGPDTLCDNYAKQPAVNGSASKYPDQSKSRTKSTGSRFGILDDVDDLETDKEGEGMDVTTNEIPSKTKSGVVIGGSRYANHAKKKDKELGHSAANVSRDFERKKKGLEERMKMPKPANRARMENYNTVHGGVQLNVSHKDITTGLRSLEKLGWIRLRCQQAQS